MSYVLLHDYFPDVAERETRTITVSPRSEFGLPAGSYGFLEMFCDEPGCDCRRVFFYVLASFQKDVQAVVAWGWEKPEFYAQWFGDDDPEVLAELVGPLLNPASPRTKLAPAILALVRDVLLKDDQYVARVKRHYGMFRNAIDEQGGDRNKRRKKKAKKARP